MYIGIARKYPTPITISGPWRPRAVSSIYRLPGTAAVSLRIASALDTLPNLRRRQSGYLERMK